MKKSRILSKPTRISEISFDEYYFDESDESLKERRLNVQKWRQFKNDNLS